MRNRERWMMSMIAGVCVATLGPAWGQVQPAPPEMTEERAQLMEEMSQAQERAREIQTQLGESARQVQEQNPELQRLHNELVAIYQSKLMEYGFPNEAEMQQLQAMQQRLQAAATGGMDEAERQQLTQRFNAEVAKQQAAQEKAQNDPQFVAAQQAFHQAQSQAMSEVNPQAAMLQQELAEVQGRIEQLQIELQQVLQAPQP
jgi:chromosome segregation ATPase